MKIKNISNQDLIIPMKKSNGDKLMVKLQPGEFVYSEAARVGDNKQLIIWTRKKAIDVTEDIKPEKCEYCKPYKPMPTGMIKTTITPAPIVFDEDVDDEDDVVIISEINVSKEAEDDIKSSPEDFWIDEDEDSDKKKPKKKSSQSDEEEDDYIYDEDDEDDEDDEEKSDDEKSDLDEDLKVNSSEENNGSIPVKSKGGRPKGVKNKDKRGRKKVKKPRGRPSKKKKINLSSNNNSAEQ